MISKTRCRGTTHDFYTVNIKDNIYEKTVKNMYVDLDNSHFTDGLYLRVSDYDGSGGHVVGVHASLDEAEELALVILAKVKERRENGIH